MTTAELAKVIGRTGTTPVFNGTIQMAVRVVDVKQSYGKTRYMIVPTAGSGFAWVENVILHAEK